MIQINSQRIIQNETMIEALSKIMSIGEATKFTADLEKNQTFEQMKKQLHEPDEIQIALEKRMDKEIFLDIFKKLHFDSNYSLQEAIEEANRNINLKEEEIKEVLEIIVKAAV